MASVRTFSKAFSGGEVTPGFHGRIDDSKYQTGLALCRNFLTAPHGPAYNRAGTRLVRATKVAAQRARVIPFSYSTDQTMVLEFGAGYLRFHTLGATLLTAGATAYSGATAYAVGDLVTNGGSTYYCIAPVTGTAPPDVTYWYPVPSAAYEIPTPYLEADLFRLRYEQSADVLTITSDGYAPRELRRLGATRWVLSTLAFASAQVPPTGISATATTVGGTTTTQTYVVTSVGTDGLDESLVSASASCVNNLAGIGAYNTISWATTGAKRYNVYKQDNGLYGFIGQTTAVTFVDDNITADVSTTPPEANDPFLGSGNYPQAVTYFEQRRFFAGTANQPQNFWGTRSGTESNLTYSIPSRDADSLAYRIAARENNTIRHMVPMQDLIMLTSSAEMRCFSSGGVLTPTDIAVKPQSYVGAGFARPVVVNNNLIFVAARGGHVREMGFSNDAGGYLTGDLSLRAPHLFDNLDIGDIAYSKCPEPIIWCVSTSGKLLSLSYVPEQQVAGWHQHDTGADGVFESVCSVAEGAEDAVYVVVRRTVGGNTVRFVERMASRQFATLADAYFVDCGLTYEGAAAITLTGLDHLEGQTVSILADGSVRPAQVVTGGAVTLDAAATKAHVGLPIVAQLQTLPLAFDTAGFGQGRQKNVSKVWLRVVNSLGIFAGPALNKMFEAKLRTVEPFGSGPSLKTGEVGLSVSPEWADGGQIFVEQRDPVPLTIASMQLETSIGG